ncbi:MAG TPA: hypothetical protein VFC84_10015 [Desulfosporosinus sp.]|nr:hypothetical protein [Desulfosporosinus sp.]
MRRRKSLLEWMWNTVQRAEGKIIRVMVLASVILVLMQLGSLKDPLEFYMSVAAKVEAPPLELPALAQSNQTWQLTLKATPAAPIRVLQNGKVLGTLNNGEQTMTVETGQIQLDGRGLSQIIQVQVINKDTQLVEPRNNYTLVIQGNVQNLTVRP